MFEGCPVPMATLVGHAGRMRSHSIAEPSTKIPSATRISEPHTPQMQP